MNHLIIKFPFSSVNDEAYVLALCLHSPGYIDNTLAALDADSEVFTHISTETDAGGSTFYYEGTLTGSVKVADDDREDIFEPIVASKLYFNMACQAFPEWLRQYTDVNWASVILYKIDQGDNYEMWRGYLVGQMLNMTVVKNLMSCSMVAVDEIGMAKYMPINTCWPDAPHHYLTLLDLVKNYHQFHHTTGFTVNGANGVGFTTYYKILGLDHSNRFLWHRDIAIASDYGDLVNNVPGTIYVNLDRWLADEKATWHDVFDAVCRYLCINFSVGAWGLMLNHDGYMMVCPTDSPTVQQFVYNFSGGQSTHSFTQYATLANPFKIGADLQVTIEPSRYKSVTVKSEPKRWERHDYLTDEEYKPVDSTKEVRYEWGTSEDPDTEFKTYGWHKLIYIKPSDDEKKFVTLPNCHDGEGYLMARDGILPYDDLNSCAGLTQPTSAVADSLDFITFKEGATCVKIGGGEIGGVDENRQLSPYFLILNHMWSNMWNRSTYTMQEMHIADTPFLTLMPFADGGPLHPSDGHYLTISMRVKFIRENMGLADHPDGPKQWLWFASPGVGHTMRVLNWQSPAILLPCEESEYTDFENSNSPYSGNMQAGTYTVIRARISVGNHYWNGNAWVTTPATCPIRMWNSTTKITETDKYGGRTFQTTNYYFTFGFAYSNTNSVDRTADPKMMVACNFVSVPTAPMQGQLKIEILGQIFYQNSIAGGIWNSVPFVLIDNVDIGWTDLAEISGDDIANERKVYMDYYSDTKEDLQREIEMASPTVDGFFDNCLLFDGYKSYHNLATVVAQGGGRAKQPEELLAGKLAQQYADSQCFVELSTPFRYDDNLYNVGFRVTSLTEMSGTFLPLKRTFDYRYERMRVKLTRLNTRSLG